MKSLIVCKAERTGVVQAEDRTIEISDPIPSFSDNAWEKNSMEFFEWQASQIVDALQASLPGGTLDAVLREMHKRKACLLRVPSSSWRGTEA